MKKLYQLLFFVTSFFLSGQTVKLPDVIKPSPQASEMTKYIDYPMDLSSGLPSTSIPIYTVDSGSLSFPITLSYHASGFKPNDDESGVVGLGWNLNAFGMISRSINNKPDENNWDQMIPLKENITGTNTDVLAEDADASLLAAVAIYGKDTSPDIFSYSLPNGQGGKFVYARNIVLSEFKKAILLPYKPLKIISYPLNTSKLDYYEIIDENGTTYRFGKSVNSGQIVNEYFRDVSSYDNFGDGVTSWLLTEIISANKKDVISFEYDDVIGKLNSNFIEKFNVQYSTNVSLVSSCNNCPAVSTKEDQIIYKANQYTQKKITRIIFNSGYVKFTYKSNLYPDQLLDKIEIFRNGVTTPMKTIKLSQTKYNNASSSTTAKYWYKLDEVGFYDSGNLKVNKYSFEYNYALFPFIETSGNSSANWQVNTCSVDFWGFYNGAVNVNLMPSNFTWTGMWGSSNMFGSADRSANYSFAQQGVLKKIIFPTGGERIFEYEANQKNTGQPLGGLRVKSITNKTDGKEIKRTFSYAGVSRVFNDWYFKKHSMGVFEMPNYYHYLTNDFVASSSPNTDININGRSIIYSKVIEYDGDAILNNGRVEHLFDTSILQLNPKLYIRSIRPPSYPWSTSFYMAPLTLQYYDVIFGDVLEKETNFYNNQGSLIKTIKKNYTNSLKQSLKAFYCSSLVTYNPTAKFRKSGAFNFYNYDILQLCQKLDSVETVEYLGGNTLETKEQYVYNDDLFVIQKTSSASNGSISNFQYKYPKDFVSQSPYDQMVTKNIIAPVIEESKSFKENPTESLKLLTTTRNLYKDWGSDNISPEFIQYSKGVTGLENRLQYYSYYVNGNVKEVSLTSGSHVVYLWGYNKTQPIAKIENATNSQIATALGVSDISILNETNLAAIDALRNNSSFANTMITTYTHIPLVGVSTVTDPKGDKTTYTYDSFGRLEFVKDKNNNILSENQYNYKQ